MSDSESEEKKYNWKPLKDWKVVRGFDGEYDGELTIKERKNQTVTPEMVHEAIAEECDYKVGRKTTVIVLILKNGFEVVGTSACVEAEKYNHMVGVEYARKRAVDKVWELLGYEYQTTLAKKDAE